MTLVTRIALVVSFAGCGTSNNATTGVGAIGAGQTTGSDGTYVRTAGATFNPVTPGFACATTTSGACAVTTCMAATVGPTPPPDPEAGVITISGGKLQTPITLTPDPTTGKYSELTAPGQAFAGGDSVMISAAGGDVAAFLSTLIAPDEVTVTTPALIKGVATPMPEAQDCQVAWTGGTTGVVVVELAWNPDASSSQAVVCSYPANAGHGTIPSAQLPSVGASVDVVVNPQMKTTTNAGAYEIDLDLSGTETVGRFAMQ